MVAVVAGMGSTGRFIESQASFYYTDTLTGRAAVPPAVPPRLLKFVFAYANAAPWRSNARTHYSTAPLLLALLLLLVLFFVPLAATGTGTQHCPGPDVLLPCRV